MKKACSLLAIAALVTGLQAPASAGAPYASGNIGISWFTDLDATETDLEDREVYSWEVSTKSGITLAAALGYDFGAARLEAEIGYQSNEAAEAVYLDDGDSSKEDFTGDVSVTTFMLNGYYDLKPMQSSDIEIFVTAGVGGAFYNFDDVGIADEVDEIGTVNGSTWAYQLGAGLSYPVGENIRIEGRYRYFKTAEFTTNDDFAGFDDEAYNLDIESHSLLVGLRYDL